MKNYIAGFRSNNSKKKKKSFLYYSIITALFVLGNSKNVSDISLFLLLLMTPSLICNFKAFIKKVKNKKKKEIFIRTLIAYLIVVVTFVVTTPNLKEVIIDSQLLSEALSKYKEVISIIDEKDEQGNLNDNNDDLVSNVYEAQLHFIDTGNSDAILIRQGGEALLIDGGDNDDEDTVVSYLKDIGVKELKYVIATHPDADHIGGLDAVINFITVEQFINSLLVSNNNGRVQIVNFVLEEIDDRLAKSIVKVFARILFKFSKRMQLRWAMPMHIMLEEAHRYVQKDRDIEILGYNIFERIAKEGRKFGVILDLITQRPTELSETVLSQCSNFIIFKLNHPTDLEYIRKMVPNISSDVIEKQKSLQSGTCVAFGRMMRIPMIVKMQMPNPEPQSSNASIYDKWIVEWKS